MKDDIAITSNLSELLMGIDSLKNRKEKIIIASGKAGCGKSTMMLYAANSKGGRGAMITALAGWNVGWMLRDLCDQLSIQHSRFQEVMFKNIVAQLKQNEQVIYVDESNLLLEGRSFNQVLLHFSMLYRIHDDAKTSIVFFGHESLPKYIRARAKESDSIKGFTQRCVCWIDFKDCGFEDARLIANARLEVAISDEQLRSICEKTDGNIRTLITLLTEFERVEKSKARK